MEHGRVGHIGIAAIYPARRNDAEGRLVRLHVMHLHRRRMRAQHVARLKIKGIVHGARRMILGDIQRGEIIEIGFDFRPIGHFEAHGTEQGLDAIQRAADRMQPAVATPTSGQRHVDGFLAQLAFEFGFLNRLAAHFQRGFDGLLGFVDPRARLLAIIRRHAAQRFQQLGQRALLAHETGLDLLQPGHVLAATDGGQGFGNDFVWITHRY